MILISVLFIVVFGTGEALVLAWGQLFGDFVIQVFPTGMALIVLQHPALHFKVFSFIYLFFLGTVIISVIVLILRVIFKDTYRRQLESAAGVIWSAGIAWAAYELLILAIAFHQFVGFLIVFAGLSLISSSLAYFVMRRYGA
jgi:hypothetical protein